MNPVRKKAYIELLIVSLIWGCASPIIKYTLGGFSPAIFLTYRFFISSIIGIIFFIFLGIKLPKDKKTILVVLLYGFLSSTVHLGLLFLGTDKTTSVDSNLISAMSPVLTTIAGVFFLREHVTKRESAGLLIALSGVFLTIVEPIIKNGNGFSGLEGNLLVFVSLMIGPIVAVLAKKILRKGIDPKTSTNISFLVGFITILPFSISQLIDSKLSVITSVPFSYHLGVIYMAVLSGTLAYILWNKAVKSIEIGEVSLFTYLYPIFGVPLSIIWLKESISSTFIIGCIVIAIGVALAEWKKRQYN
jgi:drug/metabolite transporter (DMT)-like permease